MEPRLEALAKAEPRREKSEHLSGIVVFALDDFVTGDESWRGQFSAGRRPGRGKPVCTYQRQTFQERGLRHRRSPFRWQGCRPEAVSRCRKTLYGGPKPLAVDK
jgi:hypothetical protein